MKAYEKFNRRIAELQAGADCDYVDGETDDMNPIGVMDGDIPVIFSLNVRDDGSPEYLETRFPSFSDLKRNNQFVGQLIREHGYEDPDFIKNFVEWVSDESGNIECPLYPKDVYYLDIDFFVEKISYKDDIES